MSLAVPAHAEEERTASLACTKKKEELLQPQRLRLRPIYSTGLKQRNNNTHKTLLTQIIEFQGSYPPSFPKKIDSAE